MLLNTSLPLYRPGKLPIGRPSIRYLVKPTGRPNMLRVCAPVVNELLSCGPCTLPVANDACCSASATVAKPRAFMSCAVMLITGCAVSTCDCGISEPVTVTASSFLAFFAASSSWVVLCDEAEVSCGEDGVGVASVAASDADA